MYKSPVKKKWRSYTMHRCFI